MHTQTLRREILPLAAVVENVQKREDANESAEGREPGSRFETFDRNLECSESILYSRAVMPHPVCSVAPDAVTVRDACFLRMASKHLFNLVQNTSTSLCVMPSDAAAVKYGTG